MRSLKELLQESVSEKYGDLNEFLKKNTRPKNKKELRSTIDKAIEIKGPSVDLNWIDVSKITDMSSLFLYSDFDGDISKWDVSNVEDMSDMFARSPFNGDIYKWNVSNVEDMSYMFERSKFNGDISKWDVSKVRDMKGMFKNSPLEKNPPAWYKD